MAEVLAADHDGILPLVFDDAFAYSDPEWVKILQRMLALHQKGCRLSRSLRPISGVKTLLSGEISEKPWFKMRQHAFRTAGSSF